MKKHRLTEEEKALVQQRAGRLCEYCKYPLDFSHDKFHYEHIFPLAKGGLHDLKNVALACDCCNSLKWIYTEWKDTESGLTVSLFDPRTDNWPTHFKWSDDLTEIIGLTPTGRATLVLLDMNRSGLVNARKALIAYGAHPAQKKIT